VQVSRTRRACNQNQPASERRVGSAKTRDAMSALAKSTDA